MMLRLRDIFNQKRTQKYLEAWANSVKQCEIVTNNGKYMSNTYKYLIPAGRKPGRPPGSRGAASAPVFNPSKVDMTVKVVTGSPSGGGVAGEAERAPASWVVLDRELKNEEKLCIQELQCNIVVMKCSRPKVVRLNLVRSTPSLPRLS